MSTDAQGRARWRTLTVQLVTAFVALVLLTALAVGLPAIWLIQTQSEMQAWAQVEQGSRATQALLSAQQKELDGLALLTAQRPSVVELLAQEQKRELETFLANFQEGTELDLLLVCSGQEPSAMVGDPSLDALCSSERVRGYYIAPVGTSYRLWLLATESVESQLGTLGTVIVGVALDDSYANQMKNQTGLEHFLFIGDELAAGSFVPAPKPTISRIIDLAEENSFLRTTFILNNRPFYATRLNLGPEGLVDQVALEVTNITTTQQRLVRTAVISIVLVAVIGSIVGIILARRIGWPLRQLTEAAANLSAQDLETPVTVKAQVHEVNMVARALERARVDLKRTLSELRQTSTWNDHLLESISEGILILDDEGRITFFSPGAERITDQAKEHVLGQFAADVFQLADVDEPLNHLMPQPGQIYKITLNGPQDKQTTLAMTSAQLSLPSIGMSGTALVFRDISDSERIHHLLGQFLANITHEFRTPLSALAASTELLMDQAADLTPRELQDILNALHLGILGLQTLIDNLLESASLEAGRFRVYPRPIDLKSIIIESINTMKPLQDKHSQQVSLELAEKMPKVHADPRRISQVLINLLSNAIKYSPDGSEIAVQTFEEGDFVWVVVADQGPGVPPGYRPNLFRRLVHPGNESSKAQYGVGLGLSVVKAIVEAHGGQVGVEDNSHGGASFWFTLPKGMGA